MDDYDDEILSEEFEDSEYDYELYAKLQKLLNSIQKLAGEKLRDFTTEELQMLQKVYGKNLVYGLYMDVAECLALPPSSETIH